MMNKIIYITLLLFTITTFAQKTDYNIQKGAVANGYDVVAYFSNKTIKGKKSITIKHDGVNFKFSSEKNLNTFKENPKKYIPKYGGYCAYAIGKKGEKVSIDPKTYEIRDGKLYLFYNSWGTNTLDLWKKEDPKKLQKQADVNWQKLNH